jgi:hypothetical protein
MCEVECLCLFSDVVAVAVMKGGGQGSVGGCVSF